MGSPLLPCGSCARHIRASSASCPFCGAAHTPVDAAPFEGPMPRMSRAVAFTLGAAVLAGSAAMLDGCVHSEPVYGAPFPPQDAAVDATPDAAADATPDAVSDTGNPGVRYGAPPADGG